MLIVNILNQKGAVVHSVGEPATLQEAAGVLHDKRVGAVVVLDPEGRLVGVLSERDIVREVALKGAASLASPVGAAMTRAVITAEPSETVEQGLARMTDRRIRHLPVVTDGRLLGIVSIGDLVKGKIEETEAQAAAMFRYIAAG